MNDAMGDGATHALNADRRVRPFRLDGAFLIAQFFAVRVEVLFPESVVVDSNVGDRETVQRTALGHHDARRCPILTAAINDRGLSSFQTIGSLGIVPFTPQDDARLQGDTLPILAGGNENRVAVLGSVDGGLGRPPRSAGQ